MKRVTISIILLALMSACFNQRATHNITISTQRDYSELIKFIHLHKEIIPDSCKYNNIQIGDNKFGPADYTLKCFMFFSDSLKLDQFLILNKISFEKGHSQMAINDLIFESAIEMGFSADKYKILNFSKIPSHILGPFKGGGGTFYLLNSNTVFLFMSTN